MAELSEQDKRALLGDNYLEEEKRAQEEKEKRGGAPAVEDLRTRWRNWRMSGAMVAVVGGVLFASHVFRTSANYDPKLSLASGAVAILGLAFGVFAHIELGKL